MRGGKMFFLNLGNITKAARCCLLPALFLVMGAKGIMIMIVSIILFCICIAVSVIPAPSDKKIMAGVAKFHEEFEDKYALKPTSKSSLEVKYIKGYEIKGRMFLKRHIESRAVYPVPALVALKHDRMSGDCSLVIGRLNMLHKSDPVYTVSNVYGDDFEIKTHPYSENSEVFIAEINSPEYPHGIKILFENNQMVRSYLEDISAEANSLR